MKFKENWKSIVLASVISAILAVSAVTIGNTAITELVGFAVAQSSTLWNNVKDASQGDGLSNGVIAGSPYIWNGLTFDRLKGVPAADGSTATGILADTPMVFNGTTYDRLRGGLAADALAAAGLLNPAMLAFNGATWDRVHTATGDTLGSTGLLGAGNMVWNGSSWDRQPGTTTGIDTRTPGNMTYRHITGVSSATVVKGSAGVLHSITLNTEPSAGTIQVCDHATTCSAGSIAVIGLPTSSALVSTTVTYDVAFTAGLTITPSATAWDITVSYR